MTQYWTPPNIAAICPEQHAPLTQCSPTGYMFLALITQLYGGSKDNKIGVSWPFQSSVSDISESQNFETEHFPIRQPQVSLGPVPLKTTEIPSRFPLGPELHQDVLTTPLESSGGTTSTVHSHGPGGSRGVSETSSYFPSFEFEKFQKLFNKEFDKSDSFGYKQTDPFKEFGNREYSKYHRADLDFDFEKKIFSDADAAGSENVMTKLNEKDGSKTRKKRQAVERYDFIVVGAGSAGCVVANRLSEVKQWKVLLIEAGPEEPDVTSVPAFAPVLGRSSIDWMYRTQPEEMTCRAQRGQTCAWLSGRVMGGSSSINYMVYMRGNKRDYDEWAELGNEGWSYNEILHYFKKSENNKNIEGKDIDYHAVGGPLNVEKFKYKDKNVIILEKAFHELRFPEIDFNGKRQIGANTVQTTSKKGKRVSSNEAFIKPIRGKRPNLFIKTNAQVTKVLIDNNKVAYGLQYLKNGQLLEVYANKEIILSAGALNSPKILMLSGIGPRSDLENLKIPVIMDLQVGYNLQDHVTAEAVLMSLSNLTTTLLPGKQILTAVQSYFGSRDKRDPLSATGPLHITAFYRTKYASKNKTVPDIQFHFDGRNKQDFYWDPTTYLATNIFPFSYYDSINFRPILLRPESRGYLTLNKTHPISGQPLIYPRFFTVKKDLDTLVAALKFATKLEKTKAFKENGIKFIKTPVKACSRYAWGRYKYFSCVLKSYTGTIYHPAGTCKMGPNFDENAVVNARLKVYGIENLRVADASIMPHIVRGNTNAACMMIGEKVSDMIKEDWEHVYWEPV